jgi:hypothetical protein
MVTIGDLPRNDVRLAVAVYRRMLIDGTWRPEYAGVLLRLQDDPTKLEELMEQVDQGIHPR